MQQHMNDQTVGWRYWIAGPFRHAGVTSMVLAHPLVDASDRVEEDILWDASPLTARCLNSDHAAPVADCECGYRLVTDLGELVDYFTRTHGHEVDIPDELLPYVCITRVRGSGGNFGPAKDDTPSTRRVGVLSLDTIYLPPATARWAKRYRRNFGVPVVSAPGTIKTVDKWLSWMVDGYADLAG